MADIKNGTFIEAGANDGLSQSNTWHLEKRLGWSGILVEPIPEFAQLCKRFRSKSVVYNCALGSFDQENQIVTLRYGALMTAVEGTDNLHMHGGSVASHAEAGARMAGDQPYEFQSTIRTISTLAKLNGMKHVDLFSLDVEGFEINVINGIDFEELSIGYILIETSNIDSVKEILSRYYKLIETLSKHDYLFKRI